MIENGDKELFIRGGYILFLFFPFPKEEEDGVEGISGANILNYLVVVLQQPSYLKNTSGSSNIYLHKPLHIYYEPLSTSNSTPNKNSFPP